MANLTCFDMYTMFQTFVTHDVLMHLLILLTIIVKTLFPSIIAAFNVRLSWKTIAKRLIVENKETADFNWTYCLEGLCSHTLARVNRLLLNS